MKLVLGYSQVGKALDFDSSISQVRVLLSQPVLLRVEVQDAYSYPDKDIENSQRSHNIIFWGSVCVDPLDDP